MSDHVVVLCTCPDAAVGERIARAVVEEGLAACVNLVSEVRSIYRWQDRVCDNRELLLVIKTAADRAAALRDRIVALHPYECPEVIALPVAAGHAPYREWVTRETRPRAAAGR